MNKIARTIDSNKLSAGILTVVILAVLVLSGPAAAFSVSLQGFSSDSAYKGELVSTLAEVSILGNERVAISSIDVYVDDKLEESFTAEGGESTNGKVKLEFVSSSAGYGYGYGYSQGYGYGYGYNSGNSNGILVYNVTLNSGKFSVGDHEVKLKVNLGTRTYSSNSLEIKFLPRGAVNAERKELVDFTSGNLSFSGVSLNLNLTNSENGTVSVAEYSSRPENTSVFTIGSEFGKYVQIESDLDNFDSEIRVYYTDEELASSKLAESSLRLWYYNESSALWQVYDGEFGGVNLDENYVWARTDHFSTWGIFGEKKNPPAEGGSGGSPNSRVNRLPDMPLPQQENQQENNEDSEPIELKNGLEDDSRKSNGITGAVIGALGSTSLIGIGVFILVLIGAGVTLRFVRNRKKKDFSAY